MLSALRKVLSFEMTIAEWIGTAVMLAAPYRIIGVLWPLIHSKDFANRHGLDRAVSVLGSIVVAGAVAVDGVPGMRPADCRIDIRRRTARWDPAAIVTAAEAMVFWAFAAGAANVIMQLSWPEVGYGVAESKVDSGNLLKHPWKRAGTTFQYLAVAILGRPEDRAAFREAVNSSYRQVKSAPDRCRGPTPGTSAARSCGLGRQRLPIRAGTAAARAPWRRRCRPSRSVLRRRDCRRRDCAPQWWFVGWQWIPLSSNVIRPSSSERRTPVHPSRRPYRWFRSSPTGVMADRVVLTPSLLRAEVFAPALMLTRKGGTCLMTAVPKFEVNMVPLLLVDMLQSCKQLKGLIYGGMNPRASMPMLLSMCHNGHLKLDELVTRRYRLDQINEAISDMREGRNARSRGVLPLASWGYPHTPEGQGD